TCGVVSVVSVGSTWLVSLIGSRGLTAGSTGFTGATEPELVGTTPGFTVPEFVGAVEGVTAGLVPVGLTPGDVPVGTTGKPVTGLEVVESGIPTGWGSS